MRELCLVSLQIAGKQRLRGTTAVIVFQALTRILLGQGFG